MSSALAISIRSSDIAPLAKAWAQAPELAANIFGAALQESVMLLQREVSENVPVGVTGELRQSIFSDVEGPMDKLVGVVGLTALHAESVEFGTVPHTPPLDPLIDWVEAKLDLRGVEAKKAARAIQFAIRKRGTPAQGFMKKAFESTQLEIRLILERATAELVKAVALQ